MKTSILFHFSLLLFVSSAFAFDSVAWQAKSDAMTKEASRMQFAYDEYAAKSTTPAEDITIPIDTFDSGEVKSVIIAKRGQFFREKGLVWASGITAEQYKEDGSLDFRLIADNCLIDQFNKCCWMSGPVKAYHRKTTLEGIDAFYCSSNGFLKVMNDAKVVSEDVKMKGLTL